MMSEETYSAFSAGAQLSGRLKPLVTLESPRPGATGRPKAVHAALVGFGPWKKTITITLSRPQTYRLLFSLSVLE